MAKYSYQYRIERDLKRGKKGELIFLPKALGDKGVKKGILSKAGVFELMGTERGTALVLVKPYKRRR